MIATMLAPAPDVVATPEAHARLVTGLRARLAASGVSTTLIETHISSVLVGAERAYKIKKPVVLPFLDFGDLARRERFCDEELRLNRRFAPDLYLAVVPITGTLDAPTLHGAGPVLEYAVMMRAFTQDALASESLARGAFTADHVDALAASVARAHAVAPRAEAATPYGMPADVLRRALANFEELAAVADPELARESLPRLADWTRGEHARIEGELARRRAAGRVRECHGDLHLGNVVLLDGEPTPFDALEFDPGLRWIDVMSDVAFLVMDLHDRGRPDFAHRLLNAYLEQSGDYEGVRVLRFHLVYRAMVRAKVAALRARQVREPQAHGAALREAHGYIRLAQHFTHRHAVGLLLMHGLAGSGKSTAAQALVEHIGAIRVRTDVERKRLRGLDPRAASDSPLGGGLYTDDATCRTYAAALAQAEAVLAAGWIAIVDGTFLRRYQRDLARAMGRAAGVPYVFVAVQASLTSLRERVGARRRAARRDASEATLDVLERQIATAEPLGDDERGDVVAYDSESTDPFSGATWTPVLARLGCDPLPARSIDALAGTSSPGLVGPRPS